MDAVVKDLLIFLAGFVFGNITLFISMAFFSINKDDKEE